MALVDPLRLRCARPFFALNLVCLAACSPSDESGDWRAKRASWEFRPDHCLDYDFAKGREESTTPYEAARDIYCIALMRQQCASRGAVTAYGSSKTGTFDRPSQVAFFNAVYQETFATTREWALQVLDPPYSIQTGGGTGNMDGANRGLLQAIAESRSQQSATRKSLGITAAILRKREVPVDRQRVSPLEDAAQGESKRICLYIASSFALRQMALATRYPFDFLLFMGGIGTEYEALEVLMRLYVGELSPEEVQLIFASPSSDAMRLLDGSPPLGLDVWGAFLRRLASLSTPRGERLLAESSTPTGGYETYETPAFEARRRLVYLTRGAHAPVEILRALHEQDTRPSGGATQASPRIELPSEAECNSRSAQGQPASKPSHERVANVADESAKEAALDVYCARNLVLKAADSASTFDAADEERALWQPRMLWLVGASHPLSSPRHRALAEFIEALVPALSRSLAALGSAKTQGSDARAALPSVCAPAASLPLLTTGFGGFLSQGHRAAESAGIKHLAFHLDHGPWTAAESEMSELLSSYTFHNLAIREEEAVEHAAAILVAPSDLHSEWQLRHFLMKIRQFRASVARQSLPIVLVGTRAIEEDEDWASFHRRMQELAALGTIESDWRHWFSYLALNELAAPDLEGKVELALEILRPTFAR
mgnify:CR=1 FL=1